jgi:DNA-binding transcriptional regulator YiaG
MSEKTISKSKNKVRPAKIAANGTKPVSKTFQYGKSGTLSGLKAKNAVKIGKPEAAYPAQKHGALKFKEASRGLDFDGAATAELETSPLEQETELAEQLVAEVADDSADVKELCETYQLKRDELGRLTGFSLRALAEWAGGKLPSQPAKRRLQEVRRLLDALAHIVKPGSIPRWLHQPNPAFDRLTPLQVIELGEIDRLWLMLHDMGSGQPE